jgi:hypothetical protein
MIFLSVLIDDFDDDTTNHSQHTNPFLNRGDSWDILHTNPQE